MPSPAPCCSKRPMAVLSFKRAAPDTLRHLHPGYFALVMATGIVSTAAFIHGWVTVAAVLRYLNGGFLAVLIYVTALRLIRHRAEFAADLCSHSRAVGFFTIVAAFGVFGNQLVAQEGAIAGAFACWVAAVILWPLLLYGILACLFAREQKPSLAAGLNGGWLLCVVATQSVSILTVVLLSRHLWSVPTTQLLSFLALVLWLGGAVLYLWVITLVFYRYAFLPMAPQDLQPPYWINMGAAAISTLAGTTLLQSHSSPIVEQLAVFITGLTLTFWAVGSFWIPMLIVLGVWRFIIRRLPLAYDPLYWGGVFPLGMYSVCTYHLAEVVQVDLLHELSWLFMGIALFAWCLTACGMVESVWRGLFRSG